MSKKKIILILLIVFVISNILTSLWYMITDEANYVPFRRAEPNYIGLLANHFFYACGFAFLYPTFIKKKNTLLKSILFGVVISGIMFIPSGIVVRSIWSIDFDLMFVWNTIAHLVIGGTLGVISFLTFKKRKAHDTFQIK